jgi:predicted Zn-dependent peptidase
MSPIACAEEGAYTLLRHDNGAVACVDRRPDSALTCVSIRIAGGSGADPIGRSGLAHMFEHLLFAGTPGIGRDMYMSAIEDEGAGCKATTGASWTTFSTICSPDATRDVLRLEIDRFANTVPYLDAEVLEREKKVVRSERAQRVDSAPYGDALEHLFGVLYGPSPYARIPVGIHDDIAAITLDDAQTYFADGYAAPRIAIAVSGPVATGIDHTIGELLGVFPTGSDLPPAPASGDPAVRVREVASRLPAKLYLGYLLPSADRPEFDDARLGSYLLGRGDGGHLRRRLVDGADAILGDVKVKTLTRVGVPSVGIIEATPLDGVPVDAARAGIRGALDALLEAPLDADDVERAKADYRRAWYRDDDTARGRSDGLSLAMLRSGRPSRYAEELDPVTGTRRSYDAVAWWAAANIVGEVIYR